MNQPTDAIPSVEETLRHEKINLLRLPAPPTVQKSARLREGLQRNRSHRMVKYLHVDGALTMGHGGIVPGRSSPRPLGDSCVRRYVCTMRQLAGVHRDLPLAPTLAPLGDRPRAALDRMLEAPERNVPT